MKKIFYSVVIFSSCFACQKNDKQTLVKTVNTFPKTSWKSETTNKFPLYYQFTDSTTVLIRDDSGEIPNMYEAAYTLEKDTIKLEVKTDEGGSGAMNGYKQTLVYSQNTLYLISDQMPKQSKIDTYSTPDKFIKEKK